MKWALIGAVIALAAVGSIIGLLALAVWVIGEFGPPVLVVAVIAGLGAVTG